MKNATFYVLCSNPLGGAYSIPLLFRDHGVLSGNNTEKIWAHRFFVKQKRNVPKARKTSAGGLGGAVSPPVDSGQSPGGGSGGKAPKNFRVFL